ncbi:MAG: Fic family protein [Pseudomonadota bacterium]
MTSAKNKTDNSMIPLTIEEQHELAGIKTRYFARSMQEMDEQTCTDQLIPQILEQLYPYTESLHELYTQLSDLKTCLDSFRPFNVTQLTNLQEAFDTEYTYESNRIEGNTLSLMETELVIHKGMTIAGKPLKDHFEAVNHLEAIQYIRDIVQTKGEFTAQVLSEIHSLILQGIDRANAGCYRRGNVRIYGSRHICLNYQKVPDLMDNYFTFYATHKHIMHPVELAAEMHERLVTIHPFVDGNGRTARLVMNLILLQNGYPVTIIASDRDQRSMYYNTLETAQITQPKQDQLFKKLIADYVKKWMVTYLEFLGPNAGEEDKHKGYYFFRKISPYLN